MKIRGARERESDSGRQYSGSGLPLGHLTGVSKHSDEDGHPLERPG